MIDFGLPALSAVAGRFPHQMRDVGKWPAGYVIPTRAQCLLRFHWSWSADRPEAAGSESSPCCCVGRVPGMYVEIASGMVEQWNTFLQSTCTVPNPTSAREAQLLPSDGEHWILPSDLCCEYYLVQQTSLRRRVSGLLRSAHSPLNPPPLRRVQLKLSTEECIAPGPVVQGELVSG